MMRTLEDLEDYFRYHPVVSEERKQQHERVNAAALRFATVIFTTLENSDDRNTVIQQIQIARMLANQFVQQQFAKGEGEQND